VLVHELAHALGVGYEEFGRRRAEVIVDTATYVVCGALGLDTSGYSVLHIAGWGEDGSIEAIRSCAATIDQIARRIEDSVRGGRRPGADRAGGVAAKLRCDGFQRKAPGGSADTEVW
jgi:hypothetical protein